MVARLGVALGKLLHGQPHLLARVGALVVLFEVAVLSELFLANVALKWLLGVVQSKMTPNVAQFAKSLVAAVKLAFILNQILSFFRTVNPRDCEPFVWDPFYRHSFEALGFLGVAELLATGHTLRRGVRVHEVALLCL